MLLTDLLRALADITAGEPRPEAEATARPSGYPLDRPALRRQAG